MGNQVDDLVSASILELLISSILSKSISVLFVHGGPGGGTDPAVSQICLIFIHWNSSIFNVD